MFCIYRTLTEPYRTITEPSECITDGSVYTELLQNHWMAALDRDISPGKDICIIDKGLVYRIVAPVTD